jgi:hypothetical protein
VLEGCFADSPTTPVLSGGSNNSATGMTVETCVGLAKNGGWRFAGVEAGG